MPSDVNLRDLHFNDPGRFPFLLQSTATGTPLGRFDILFANPGETFVADQDSGPHDFLRRLDALWAAVSTEGDSGELPFSGGWFLYLGYEMAAEIEPALNLLYDDILPRAFAVRCRAAVIRDHASGKQTAVCEASGADDMEKLRSSIDEASAVSPAAARRSPAMTAVTEDQPEEFLKAVDTAKRYIAAGDIFQANLSRQWLLASELSAREVFDRLALNNPSPFAGSAHWDGSWIISSSPERLLSLRHGVASTRPIAGTRPRGTDPAQDRRFSAELIAHPKERAEHVMLIDLERNDLGRICEAGSVEVDEMMVVESYAHVHHIVSNVRGRLRRDVSPGEAIRAVFPGGTITGCPKVRCMQIISELENAARGAYTGSFGYLNRDGSMDLNILIRTLVKTSDRLRFRAGAGIVADSDPDAELAETRAKAKGLLEALR